MDTIGKFRTNFLGKGRSFKIGFNNRSPFSYISSTGPAVPATYDGGVPLVNFKPSQYAQAFDTSDAVRAEHEMFKKVGEVAGKVAGAVGSAVVGGFKATNNPGAGFGDFFRGAADGFKNPPKLSDEARKGIDSGMSDIRKNSSSSNKNLYNPFQDYQVDNNTTSNNNNNTSNVSSKATTPVYDCIIVKGGKWENGKCSK